MKGREYNSYEPAGDSGSGVLQICGDMVICSCSYSVVFIYDIRHILDIETEKHTDDEHKSF